MLQVFLNSQMQLCLNKRCGVSVAYSFITYSRLREADNKNISDVPTVWNAQFKC